MTRKNFRKSTYKYDRSEEAVFADRDLLIEIRKIAGDLCQHVIFVSGEHAYDDLDELARYEGEKLKEIYIIGYDNKEDEISLYSGYKLQVMFAEWKVEVEWDKESGKEPEELSHIMELVAKQPKFEFRNLHILNCIVTYSFLYCLTGSLFLISAESAIPIWLWVILGSSLVFMHFFTLRDFIGSRPISLSSGKHMSQFFRKNSNQLLLLIFGAAMGGFFAALFNSMFGNGSA